MRFREVLRLEFERRRRRNPRYSLRRYAGALQVHHAVLSRLFGGQGAVPARRVRALAKRLALHDAEIERMAVREEEQAILAVVGRADFRPDVRWLAAVSGIPADRIQLALPALLGRGRLRMESTTRWVAVPGKETR